MWRYCGRGGRGGWMRPVGVGLIFLGALLLVLVIPPRLWAALLGAALIAIGAILLKIG